MRKAKNMWLLWTLLVIIVFSVGATLLNFYIDNKKTTNINKDTIGTRDIDWVEQNAYFTINMKVNDRDYEIYLVGEGEKKSQLAEDNTLGKKDDTIVRGDFSFYLWNEEYGQLAYRQDVQLPNPMTFNLSAKNSSTYMVNQQNIAAILQENSKNNLVAYFYSINKNKLISVSDGGLNLSSRNIKSIQQNYLQTMSKQDEENVHFDTWMLEKNKLKLEKVDETLISDKEVIAKWLEEGEYYYPFKNVKIDSNIITLAEQGLLIGTQYPIGTSIKEIIKINPDYVVKDADIQEARLIFPEVTYYYDTGTEMVTSVSIPGVRLKESIQSFKNALGEPNSLVNIDNEYMATYDANNYQLLIHLDESQMIQSIQLKRK